MRDNIHVFSMYIEALSNRTRYKIRFGCHGQPYAFEEIYLLFFSSITANEVECRCTLYVRVNNPSARHLFFFFFTGAQFRQPWLHLRSENVCIRRARTNKITNLKSFTWKATRKIGAGEEEAF